LKILVLKNGFERRRRGRYLLVGTFYPTKKEPVTAVAGSFEIMGIGNM